MNRLRGWCGLPVELINRDRVSDSDERITSFQHKISYQVEEGLAFEATRSDACAFEVRPDHVNKVLISLIIEVEPGKDPKRGQKNKCGSQIGSGIRHELTRTTRVFSRISEIEDQKCVGFRSFHQLVSIGFEDRRAGGALRPGT